MTKSDTDILYFVSFCVEHFKKRKQMTSSEVMDLFDECHITEYLQQNYEVLHTQSAQWLMEEIEEKIKNLKK